MSFSIQKQVPGNSLAEKAGLHPTSRGFAGNIVLGDIIVAVDDKPVSSMNFLHKNKKIILKFWFFAPL